MSPATKQDYLMHCDILALVQSANREGIACHVLDDRLIVSPGRAHRDLTTALIARGDEVADFLARHRVSTWRTPVAEEMYREQMADEMTVEMFGLPWRALCGLAIDQLSDVIGDAWVRYCTKQTVAPFSQSDECRPTDSAEGAA